MATRVLPFVCSIPANTAQASPVTIPINLDGWTLEQLDLEVPPGPAGLMGFQVYNNGVAWIPYGAGNWIVWDDHSEQYYVTDQPNAGGWSVVGYNLGQYAHAVTIRAHVSPATGGDTTSTTPSITITTSDAPTLDPVTL